MFLPADKAANNVVVIWRLHYIDTLKQELGGTKAYELQPLMEERSVLMIITTIQPPSLL